MTINANLLVSQFRRHEIAYSFDVDTFYNEIYFEFLFYTIIKEKRKKIWKIRVKETQPNNTFIMRIFLFFFFFIAYLSIKPKPDRTVSVATYRYELVFNRRETERDELFSHVTEERPGVLRQQSFIDNTTSGK